MTRDVVVSATFAKQFRQLAAADKRRVRAGLKALAVDALRPRVGADIKPLVKTEPLKHRLRVGDFRIVYRVEKRRVLVIEVFQRRRGYRE